MQMNRIVATALLFFAIAAGPAAAQHTVSLSWTASSTTGATYNVYREQACSENFAILNGTAVTATTYTDPAVAPGETYCYEVTAVSGGLESTPTNPAPATIPAAISAPTAAQSNGRGSCTRRTSFLVWSRCVAALPRKGN